MDSLLWQFSNRTAEMLLVLNLFHLLLAGLTVLLLLRQRRLAAGDGVGRPDRLLILGFSLLSFQFALLTLYFGAAFFLRGGVDLAGVERISHGLLVAGALSMMAASGRLSGRLQRLLIPLGFVALTVLVLLDASTGAQPFAADRPPSIFILLSDAFGVVAMLRTCYCVHHSAEPARRMHLVAIASLALVFLLHGAASLVSQSAGIFVWNAQEHLLSLSLFGFAWAIGERSRKLLDRVFVRLNVTFIVLASIIMLVTAGMEKYQYFRLAEERSTDLAEFLRGHVIYYGGQGETLQQVFDHPEVMKRVIVEFGTLPELRKVNIYFGGERVSFHYSREWEIAEDIGPVAKGGGDEAISERNSFRMIRLPIGENGNGHLEFIGTTEFVNRYIGSYIILIYCAFTVVVALASLIIGIIVADTDRQLRRQYDELREAQQQLAQSAKLASIGELAGGMAHEINNPVTSILSLASHMAENGTSARLTARERKNMKLIADQASRISNLVGGLLTFSRQTQMHLSEVDIRQLLGTALELLQYRLGKANILVHTEIALDLPRVKADGSRLTEVFVNLISNAMDAMPSGGNLTVRALAIPGDGAVRVEVEDTGMGIPDKELSRIFDPFFTTKPPGRGTGLGLSISHGIIKDHGGEISARSTVGAGTTVIISLPQEGACYETASAGH